MHLPIIEAILPSNENHREWPKHQVARRLGELKGKRVAVLGVAYKPGTDIGTVAVLAKATEKGIIKELQSVLEELRKAGFRFPLD